MARRSAHSLLAAVTVLVLVSACGSTVQQVGSSAAGDQGLGTGDVSSTSAGTSGLGTPVTTTGAAPSAGLAGAQAPSLTDGATPASLPSYSPTSDHPSALAATEAGRGFTKTTVQIGIADSDVDSYANTLGLKGISTGDETAQVNAIVSTINRHGGLLGRKIELVWYHASSAQTLNNPSQVDEAACATWTQDHHVYAVLGPLGIPADGDLLACLAKTHTPLIGAASPWGLDSQPYYQPLYDKYPSFVNIDSMLGETLDRISVERLVARGFFEPWDTTKGGPATGAVKPPVKIGLVVHDNPTGELALAAMTRELAKHHLTITDVARLPDGVTEQSAAGQNAVLRFHSDGITHELGNVGLAFAEGQKYRPRYFIPNEPQVIAANAPASQMNGAMAESYIPTLDVGEDPGPPSKATTTCLAIMRAAGQDTTSGTARFLMESACDGFFFLQAATAASGSLSDLTTGFNRLGSRVPSALTWGTNLGPRQHATATTLRDAGYKASCSCFAYTSNHNYS